MGEAVAVTFTLTGMDQDCLTSSTTGAGSCQTCPCQSQDCCYGVFGTDECCNDILPGGSCSECQECLYSEEKNPCRSELCCKVLRGASDECCGYEVDGSFTETSCSVCVSANAKLPGSGSAKPAHSKARPQPEAHPATATASGPAPEKHTPAKPAPGDAPSKPKHSTSPAKPKLPGWTRKAQREGQFNDVCAADPRRKRHVGTVWREWRW